MWIEQVILRRIHSERAGMLMTFPLYLACHLRYAANRIMHAFCVTSCLLYALHRHHPLPRPNRVFPVGDTVSDTLLHMWKGNSGVWTWFCWHCLQFICKSGLRDIGRPKKKRTKQQTWWTKHVILKRWLSSPDGDWQCRGCQKHIRRGRMSGRKPERERDYSKERVGGEEERKDGVGGYNRAQGYTEETRWQ